jgi:5-methylcytosine-specific restriction endonuclease McrA
VVGSTFGRWTVMGPGGVSAHGGTLWNCRCVCGRNKNVDVSTLKNGTSTSCGICCRVKSRKLPQGEAGFRNAVSHYQANAKAHGRTCTLTQDDFKRLFSGNCFYCGAPPSIGRAHGWSRFVYSGIDRIDNSSGYDPDNTVSCCKVCNRAKYNMSQGEFLSWLKRANAYQDGRPVAS